ncbi:MAG: PilZ domain-containing protein [Candidatus Omnitrophica bacterium]|nr:PilZ domain-containing protein [Candidatus Omnitrophota bacterium]
MEERRKFVRIKDLKSVEVRVKNNSGKMELVEIKDMSLNGINFYSEMKLEKERLLQMNISLPDGFNSMNIEGKVFWQLPSLDNKFATGVKFCRNNAEVEERLSKFIRDNVKSVNENREFIRCVLNTNIVIIDLSDPSVRFAAKTVDISHGGMKLALVNKIEIGARIKLSLVLPQDQEAIEVKARVVWVRKERDNDGCVVGIIYTELNAAGKNKIFKFIKNHCKSS